MPAACERISASCIASRSSRRHRDVGERAEAGAHAVHDRAALDRVGDDAAGGRHPRRHVRAELGPGPLPGHVHHVVECEPVAVDENRPHPQDRSAGYPPPVRTLVDWIDAVNAAHPWSHNDHYIPWVLRQLPPHARDALDVGCGTGTLLAALAGRLPHVEGIDRDPAMAARSGARQVDLFDLPAEPAYDVVTAVAVLHHLPLEPALTRLRSLLRPGGRLLVVGCYRQATTADRATDLLAVPANLAIGVLSRRRAEAARSRCRRQPRGPARPWGDPGGGAGRDRPPPAVLALHPRRGRPGLTTARRPGQAERPKSASSWVCASAPGGTGGRAATAPADR